MSLRRLFACLSLCLLVFPASAQDGLLSPEAFLGYELGSRFTRHHRVVDYVEHVAAHSPNVRLEQYGETYEGRPLLVAYVARPDYLARLEEIRTDNLKLAGVLEGQPSGPTPAIVWLSYNVHGNESVSTEAAMKTLYDLADPANARTQAWLANAVVVIDPAINPDGRDRYVNWYNQVVGRTPNPLPEAREHHEPWPGGRTNHYYFDLNRDWSWMTQQETQGRLPLYNRWLPHVHVDFHEQGVDEPYYFAPAAEPYHADITPWQRAFQATIGRNHARYFDDNAWLYFTRQVFDLLYPGYGDTWPIYNGAIGMTYEQGGSGRAGLAILTSEGDTLTLADRIAHHYTTGLSTVETAAREHAQVVDEFHRYFEQARSNPPGAYRTYVVKGSNPTDRLRALADHLRRQGIAFGYATQRRTARGYRYLDDATGAVTVEPGDLVISAYQPKSVLLKVLFDPEPALSDSLTYDITAWALPYAYGVEAAALTDRIGPDAFAPPASTPALPAVDRPYAYLLEWQSLDDVRFLANVLQHNIRLRFAEAPFEVEGRRFGRGTLILTRTGNEALGERFDDVVRSAAEALQQPLFPVTTGLVTQGADFGSSDVPFLKRPRVAVLSGPEVSSYAVGEAWHFFDQQIAYPVTLIHTDDFDPDDLDGYDVLILPSGSYGDVLSEARLAAVRSWIRDGGRLIALERAVGFLVGKDGFGVVKAPEPLKPDTLGHPLRRYEDRARAAISDDIPGSIYRVRLDDTHPLGFGYSDTYFTLKRGADAFAYLKEGWNVGVIEGDAHVSGFAGHRARRKLENTLVFGAERMGRGQVVYLVDNPLFRGFWHSGKLLFANAVFMVGQ